MPDPQYAEWIHVAVFGGFIGALGAGAAYLSYQNRKLEERIGPMAHRQIEQQTRTEPPKPDYTITFLDIPILDIYKRKERS